MPSKDLLIPLSIPRTLAWLSVLVIVGLSVVPGGLRPHVMEDKHIEHFAAYVVAGCLFAIGYHRVRLVLLFGVLLTLCAAAMEIAQLGIAGRTSSLSDLIASAAGTWTGLAIGPSLRATYLRALGRHP